jgi:hypothetical protein
MKVTTHVAQNNTTRRSAIDGRTTLDPGHAISRKKRDSSTSCAETLKEFRPAWGLYRDFMPQVLINALLGKVKNYFKCTFRTSQCDYKQAELFRDYQQTPYVTNPEILASPVS